MGIENLNWELRIIEKNPWIAISRVRQIMDILDNDNRIWDLENFNKDERYSVIRENRELATNEIMTYINEIQKKDKSKMRKLSVYLKNFVSKLNLEDISWLYKVLGFYKDIYEEYNLAQDDLIDMLDMWLEVESLYTILYNFLSKAVLLPDAKNSTQEFFNKQMDWIIFRLEQSLNNETLDKGFVMNPINPASIISAMYDQDVFTTYWNIDLNSKLISSFWYNFSLMSIDQNEDFGDEMIVDDCSFEFQFTKLWELGLSRDEFILNLGKLWISNEIEPGIYFIDWTQKVNVLLEVSRKQMQKTADWIIKERYRIVIYTEDISNQKWEEFLESSLYALTKNTDFIINSLYEFKWEFPSVQDRITINYETITGEKEIKDDEDGWTILESNNKESKKISKKKEENNKYNINDKLTLDSLILNENNMDEIEELADYFENSTYYIENWVDFPKGAIFYWPSWNWKTLTAKVLSNKIDWEFKLIEHSKIEDKWVWWSEKNIKKEFDDARSRFNKTWKKQILVIDEWDSLLEARWDQKNHKEWIVSIVLWEMDWFDEKAVDNIFVIILTNRLNSIDSAILSRFDKKIKFELPNRNNIKKHLILHIEEEEKKSWKQVFDTNLDYSTLIEKIEWKSGRFINTLIKNSKRKYFKLKRTDETIELINTDFILAMIENTEWENKKDKVMWFNI